MTIPEQFTVKTHPALFDGEESQEMRHCYSSLQSKLTLSKRAQNTKTAKAS